MHHDYDNDGYGWSKTSPHFYPWENWNKFACDRFLSDYNIIPLPLYRNPYVRNPCRAQSLICVSYIFSNSSFIRIADCTQTNVCVRVRNCDQYIAIYGHIIYPWYPPHSLSLSHAYGWHQYFPSQLEVIFFHYWGIVKILGLKHFQKHMLHHILLHKKNRYHFEVCRLFVLILKCMSECLCSVNLRLGRGNNFRTHTHNRKGAYRHHFKRILKCRVGRNNLSRCVNTIMLLALLCVAPLIVL